MISSPKLVLACHPATRTPIRFGVGCISLLLFAATIQAQPVASATALAPTNAVATGQKITMSVSAMAAGVSFRWRLNGTDIPRATAATYAITAAGAMDAGNYEVVVTDPTGSTTVAMGALTMSPSDAKLVNLSARGSAGTGMAEMVMGFVSQPDVPGAHQSVLLRGMGPSLGSMMGGGGMMQGGGVLQNPILTLYDRTSHMMATDTGWTAAPTVASGPDASTVVATMQPATMGMMQTLGAFSPTSTADAAMMMNAPAGIYTAAVSGGSGPGGIVLAECYDAEAIAGVPVTAHLVNMSARANVGSGNAVLIGGFVIAAGPSGASTTVLLRAMGPSLSMLGVTGWLTSPTMTLYDRYSKPIATNTAWTTAPTLATGDAASSVHAGIEPATIAAMAKVGAFTPMAGAADSGMLATVPPGIYTVMVSGAPDSSGVQTSGVALLEIYQIR
jgi:hypothetical protein